MKNRVIALWTLAMVAIMVSCSVADVEDMMGDAFHAEGGEYVTAFGTAYPEEEMIVTDAGFVLSVKKLASPLKWEDIEEGRILFNYSVLEATSLNSYNVRINSIYPLIVKDILVCNDESDGDHCETIDPAMPYQASYSGGYLNIHVYYPSQYSLEEEIPDIELCYDEEASTDDTILLTLRHKASNGFDDEDSKSRDAWYSFRIVPEETLEDFDDADLFAFRWCWWLDEGDFSKGVERDNMSVMYTDSYDDGGRCGLYGSL